MHFLLFTGKMIVPTCHMPASTAPNKLVSVCYINLTVNEAVAQPHGQMKATFKVLDLYQCWKCVVWMLKL